MPIWTQKMGIIISNVFLFTRNRHYYIILLHVCFKILEYVMNIRRSSFAVDTVYALTLFSFRTNKPINHP